MIIFKDIDETVLTAAALVLEFYTRGSELTLTYIAGQQTEGTELTLTYTTETLCRADYKRLLGCCV